MTPPHPRPSRGRVLLVGLGVYHMQPITLLEPLGIACIGAFLRQEGFEVELLHLVEAETAALLDRVARFQPQVVGFSCYTSNWSAGRAAARELREHWSGFVVFGGIHATLHPEIVREEGVDYAVLGEGEHTMLALCEVLLEGRGRLEEIPGLAWLRDGEVATTGLAPRIVDLDRLPLPMRDGLPMDRYRASVPAPRYRTQRAAAVSATRGCQFNCSFCTTPYALQRQRHARSVPHVMAELQELRQKHGVNTIYFCDEDMAFDRAWLLDLCAALVAADLRLGWYCFARISSLDPELLEAMARGGCTAVGLGIESPDARSLRRIGKGVEPEDMERVLGWVDRAGIWSIGFFMLGLPWQGRKDILEAARFASSIPLDILYPSFATPFPHTRLYDEAIRSGLLRSVDPDVYSNLTPVMATPTLEVPALKALFKQVMLLFYGNPRRLLRLGRRLRRDPVPLLSVLDAMTWKAGQVLGARASLRRR